MRRLSKEDSQLHKPRNFNAWNLLGGFTYILSIQIYLVYAFEGKKTFSFKQSNTHKKWNYKRRKKQQQKTSAIWNSYRICSNFFLETQLVFLDVMCRERNLRERGFVILSVSQPHSLDDISSSFSVLFCVALFVQGMILQYNL